MLCQFFFNTFNLFLFLYAKLSNIYNISKPLSLFIHYVAFVKTGIIGSKVDDVCDRNFIYLLVATKRLNFENVVY